MMHLLLPALAVAIVLAGCGPDAASELALGKRLLTGGAGAPADARAAVPHLRHAAAGGLPAAAYHLGLLYQRGAPGLQADRAAALHWLGAAAQTGLPQAQFMLGQMLLDPLSSDPAQARLWFEKAATQEHAEANLELAMAYRRGDLGLLPDEQQAERYLMESQHAQKHRSPPP
ncbi:MAG: sel1 repeat family protein [Ramlibacter sp.]|nr:sel1 repeat family protein [Ramlibacter sp.]